MNPGDIGAWMQAATFNGSMAIALPVALVAGLISFFSPCVVPLLPGYLSYATGLSGSEITAVANRRRTGFGGLLFVSGFSLVFLSYGALFGQLGAWLFEYQATISMVLGIVVVLVGLTFVGALPFLQGDSRVHGFTHSGLAAAPILGFLFGLGWSPCLGPTLTAVVSLAATEASAVRGAVLSLAYCFGLGIPFIVAGLYYPRMLGLIGFVRRHHAWVTRIGGAMLIAVGLLLVTGLWDSWIGELRNWAAQFPAVV